MGLNEMEETLIKIMHIVNRHSDKILNLGMPNWEAHEVMLDALENLERKWLDLVSLRRFEVDPKEIEQKKTRPETSMRVALSSSSADETRTTPCILTAEHGFNFEGEGPSPLKEDKDVSQMG